MSNSTSSRRNSASPPTESSPLLSDTANNNHYGQNDRPIRPNSVHSYDHSATTSASKRRWPSYVALFVLCIIAVLIMVFGFFLPDVMQQYAMQAATIELGSLVPEFTESGARARIRGTFMMKSSNVRSARVRKLGAFGTWIARKAETSESIVNVTLPEYGNVLLGTAVVPPIKVSIVNGRKTDLDIVADLIPPKSVDGVKMVVEEYLNRTLDHLNIQGLAQVKLRSGIISLPEQQISHTITLRSDQIPERPKFNITRLTFHEGELPDHTLGMLADASIKIENDFPLDLQIPPLYFDLLVENCKPHQPKIVLADIGVGSLHVLPKRDVTVNAAGFIHPLPDSLTDACPSTGRSPLDTLLGGYMKGHDITIFIRGSKDQSSPAPPWMADMLSSFTVPVPVPGHTFGDVIHNFTLADVKFSLPDPFAEPDEPESNPQVSATIQAYVALPQEVNFDVDVQRTRATADVLYKKKKMGELNLLKWQPATSTKAGADEEGRPLLLVESDIKNVPLEVTDEDLFTDLVQALLFGGKPVMLQVNAKVDVEINTTLGVLTVREIPAEGTVPVKPISSGGGFDSLEPKVNKLAILNTSNESITIEAEVGFKNPTEYSADIPFADVNILVNNTMIGHALAHNLSVTTGENKHIKIQAVLDPSASNDKQAREIGRNVISQFISGWNISLTIQTHEGTFPNRPSLGKALSKLKLEFPVPHIRFPGDDDDPDDPDGDNPEGPRFIKSATMHLFSSTAEFALQSPLSETTIYMTSINATAYYEGDAVGTILYDLPLAIPPGISVTPRLPVEWNLGSVGYDAVKQALGGQLKLQAVADIGIRIGKWEETIWYVGKGIGAKIRL